MEECKIIYKINSAEESEIYAHLDECSNRFDPPLEERVNLREYSGKLHKQSVTFEAWVNDKLIGLLACYFNDPQKKTGFISSVSTLEEFTRKGIASKLIQFAIEYGVRKEFKKIELEVHNGNNKAKNLYKKFGFRSIDNNDSIQIFQLIT